MAKLNYPLLLNTFRFEVSLRKSAHIEAGSNALMNNTLVNSTAINSRLDSADSTSPDLLGNGGFQECSGLEISMDVQEYLEGGRNDGVIQRVGRAKFSNIVLKRGMFYGEDKQVKREIWQWLQQVLAGKRPVTRYDGIVEIKSQVGSQTGAVSREKGGETVATWVFERGLPAKIVGPQLNAKTGEIAIEELHIAHEGLRLVAS